MLRTYITYAIIAAIAICAFLIALRYVIRWFKICRYRRLLPYSDIVDDVENLNDFFNRSYVNKFILDYFKEDDHLKDALQIRREERKK